MLTPVSERAALVENRSDVPLSCNLCREASQITILLEHDPQKPTRFTGACFRHVKEVVALYDSEQGRVARGPRTVPQTTCVGGNLLVAGGSLANDTSKSAGENPKDPQTACAGWVWAARWPATVRPSIRQSPRTHAWAGLCIHLLSHAHCARVKLPPGRILSVRRAKKCQPASVVLRLPRCRLNLPSPSPSTRLSNILPTVYVTSLSRNCIRMFVSCRAQGSEVDEESDKVISAPKATRTLRRGVAASSSVSCLHCRMLSTSACYESG